MRLWDVLTGRGCTSLFGAESTFTQFNIALQIVPQILDAIGCCWKRGLAIAGYSAWEIPTIPGERGQRLFQNARTHTGTAVYRSEERRVGKEGRAEWRESQDEK